MGAIETKTFKSGNSVAVRLPKGFGLKAGTSVILEQTGTGVMVRPKRDPEEGRRSVARLIAALEAIGPVGEIEKREPPEAPERHGL